MYIYYKIEENYLEKEFISNYFHIKKEKFKDVIEIIFKKLNKKHFPIGGIAYNKLEKKIYFNLYD